ncbi:uncharacterized protein ACO6RY_13973 [Pungitius sinensis]
MSPISVQPMIHHCYCDLSSFPCVGAGWVGWGVLFCLALRERECEAAQIGNLCRCYSHRGDHEGTRGRATFAMPSWDANAIVASLLTATAGFPASLRLGS